MLYTELTSEALKFAYKKHHGQVDKAGVPYIFHPLAVVEFLPENYQCNETAVCAALLHDTLEDTNTTKEELAFIFGQKVADTVDMLTRPKGMSYDEYIKRIAQHGSIIAISVKIADLFHNSMSSRLTDITNKDLVRIDKYQKYIAMLDPDKQAKEKSSSN